MKSYIGSLADLNARGAGVFVTVNETDGQGRKSDNIVRIRAIWQEDDQGLCHQFPIEPSMIVQTSKGKFHRYWLVDAGPEFTGTFSAVMDRMVSDYGSDRNAKDISRVLRVPGFFHRKGDPVMVELVATSGHRYSGGEITAAFPPVQAAL